MIREACRRRVCRYWLGIGTLAVGMIVTDIVSRGGQTAMVDAAPFVPLSATPQSVTLLRRVVVDTTSTPVLWVPAPYNAVEIEASPASAANPSASVYVLSSDQPGAGFSVGLDPEATRYALNGTTRNRWIVTSVGPYVKARAVPDAGSWTIIGRPISAVPRIPIVGPPELALANAARTANATSDPQQNRGFRGIAALLGVNVASGTGGLHLRIQAYDQRAGQWRYLNASPTAVTATGFYYYELYPGIGAASGDIVQRTSGYLGSDLFRLVVLTDDSSSYTYYVDYQLLP